MMERELLVANRLGLHARAAAKLVQLLSRYQSSAVLLRGESARTRQALHRWLGIIGLKREAALRGFGKNGETFHQFAWVADHVG